MLAARISRVLMDVRNRLSPGRVRTRRAVRDQGVFLDAKQ